MTNEQKIAKLAALKEQAENSVMAYNAAMQEGKFDDALRHEEDTANAITEYTSIVRTMCFDRCRESENPMLTAIQTLSYMTIATKDHTPEGSKVAVREVVDKEKAIDLLKLHKYCGGIGVDKQWPYIVQKINYLLTVQTAIDLGLKPERLDEIRDCYAIADIARDIEMGKTPTSKTNILKTMQAAVDAMIGEEYKALTHDVNFILKTYSKRGKKALSVAVSKHSAFVDLMAQVCHRIVTNGRYDMEYQQKK